MDEHTKTRMFEFIRQEFLYAMFKIGIDILLDFKRQRVKFDWLKKYSKNLHKIKHLFIFIVHSSLD